MTSPAKRADTKTSTSTATTTAAATIITPVKDFSRGWPQSGHTRAAVDASAPHSGQYRYRIAGMPIRLSNRGHRGVWQPVGPMDSATHFVRHLSGPEGRPTPCRGIGRAWAAGGSRLLDPQSGGPDLGLYPSSHRFKPERNPIPPRRWRAGGPSHWGSWTSIQPAISGFLGALGGSRTRIAANVFGTVRVLQSLSTHSRTVAESGRGATPRRAPPAHPRRPESSFFVLGREVTHDT